MALIKCPECGATISDQALDCIHCGFPLQKMRTIKSYGIIIHKYYNTVTQMTYQKDLLNIYIFATGKPEYEAANIIYTLPIHYFTGLDKYSLSFLKAKLEKMGCEIEIIESNEEPDDVINERLKIVASGAIICPRCHNASVTTGQRGYSFMTGFIGSGKTVNRCAKCGYSWKP